MTIRDGLRRMGREMARLAPHDATVQLPGAAGPGIEDEFGNVEPGPFLPGPTYPCHAARVSAEDAVRAGLSSSAEVWQIVVDAPAPITPDMTLTVTLRDGSALALSVTRVSGTVRVTALCGRSG